MGISLLSSYHGAQIFEAIGIGEDLLNLGFRGTPSRLGGLKTEDLACETASFMVSPTHYTNPLPFQHVNKRQASSYAA